MAKTAVVVTGASRGFGRAVAIAFTAELGLRLKSADLFLWARNAAKLQETETAIQEAARKFNTEVRTFSSTVDLGDQTSYVGRVQELIQQLQIQQPAYETIYVVHNAATVGQLGCTETWQSVAELAGYWELNLTSVCFINARLLAAFRGHATTRLALVNISSGAATNAVAGNGLYCTGKAAREMHFRVVAEENKPAGAQVRVLNYSPGAMDTDMQDEIRESPNIPQSTRDMFMEFREKGLVRAEDSALYCAQLTVGDAYESGTAIRFDQSKFTPRDGLFQ